MKHMSPKNTDKAIESDLLNDVENIQSMLSRNENLQPESFLDKQIIAAAHREANNSQKAPQYRISNLRRWSLPLYIASGFVLTVFAYNSLWYVPVTGETNEATESTVIKIEESGNYNEFAETAPKREPRSLPKHVPPTPAPERVVTSSSSSQNELSSEMSSESSLIKQGIYTGNEFTKAEFPEKEAWVRTIIDHLKNGESELAKNELVAFKKAYPNYPLEEQIRVLSQ